MTMVTHEQFALIDSHRGLIVRTAPTLKELITELILNSGEEIALWAEGEAQRCADVWRHHALESANAEISPD